MDFKPGEVCVRVDDGRECTILEAARTFAAFNREGKAPISRTYCVVEYAVPVNGPKGNRWAVPVERLRRKRPPAEFEAGSWSECVWKPVHLKVPAQE